MLTLADLPLLVGGGGAATPIPDVDDPVAIYRLPNLEPIATQPVTQRGISGQREKNGPGSGQFTVSLDDPAHALIEPGLDVMAFRRPDENGDLKTVHSCVVEEIDEHTLDPDGSGRQTATYKGRGTGIVLDWAPIPPAGGFRRRPKEIDGVGDWRSLRNNPANQPWEMANEIMSVDAALGSWPHQPMGEGFTPSTGAQMLLSDDGDGTNAPFGWYLFYRDYNILVGGRYGIELLMDDLGLFWVDNILQLDVSPTDGFVRASFKRLVLSAEVHRFCWAVYNFEDPAAPGEGLGPAALAYNLYKADLQDRPLADGFYAVSDSSVNVLPVFGGDWPTMLVGDILMDFWLEVIALGWQVGHLVPTWTRLLDSDGQPWPIIGTGDEGGVSWKTCRTTIMGFLSELQAAGHIARWRVRPDAVTWDVWAPGYTNRPGDVELLPAPVDDPRTGQLLLLDRRRT